MAFEAATILALIGHLVWLCMSTTPKKQKQWMYSQVFPTLIMVENILASASVVFAPGLFEVLQASTSPSIAFFKTLPTEASKKWGLYVIVLEKQGRRPKLYIGSGTQARYGVSNRLVSYTKENANKPHHLPLHVESALLDGYSIVHKGLLCWIPIPTAADVPVLRTLFVALEASLAFVFWALRAKTDYGHGMVHMCPWDRATLEYGGLCSHNPLMEILAGDFDLSAEELEAKAKDRADKIVQSRKRWAEENPEGIAAIKKHAIIKALDEQRYSCELCEMDFADSNKLIRHNEGSTHLDKVAIAEGRAPPRPFYCQLCKKGYNWKN